MNAAKFITCLLALSLPALGWDDPLLTYIERYPYYTSDALIPKDLSDEVARTCDGSTITTFRQAALVRFHYDRAVQVRRRAKEGVDYFEPGIGPQADGFLCTIRLSPNTFIRREAKTRIDRVSVDAENQVKRAGGLILTKDGTMFYNISIEAGMDVSDERLKKMIEVVRTFAVN